jgi:hypothetical protein
MTLWDSSKGSGVCKKREPVFTVILFPTYWHLRYFRRWCLLHQAFYDTSRFQ